MTIREYTDEFGNVWHRTPEGYRFFRTRCNDDDVDDLNDADFELSIIRDLNENDAGIFYDNEMMSGFVIEDLCDEDD